MNSIRNPAYQAGMEVRFAIAARHSRLVRLLRIAVPAAVALAMAAILGASFFNNPFRAGLPELPVDFENVAVSGTKITMKSPHTKGFTPDQRPYEVWAKTATQDVTDPDHVELDIPRAKMLMEDQTTMTLVAKTGLLDNKQQQLNLRKDIVLQTSSGYEARLSQAFIDMAKNEVTSDEHVDVKLLNGTLTADRLRISGGGEVVRFEGHVVMNLDNLGPPTPPADPEPPVRQEKTKSASARPPGAR